MKIYEDILACRVLLDKIEEQMRAGVPAAEKRLGTEAVLQSFFRLSQAQKALRDLDAAVRPLVESYHLPSAEWLMENGYM